MKQRLTIVTLGVNNLETSNTFYEKIFGWKKLSSSNEGVSFFQLNGILLSLYPREKLAEDAQVSHEGNGFKAFSLAYVIRNKQEVDDIMSTLKTKGVKIVKPPEEVFWGGYSGYIADPDKQPLRNSLQPLLTT